jgi:hypothetical protein
MAFSGFVFVSRLELRIANNEVVQVRRKHRAAYRLSLYAG